MRIRVMHLVLLLLSLVPPPFSSHYNTLKTMIASDIPIAILTVTVIQARHVPDMDMFGNTDAYVKLSLDTPPTGEKVQQTQVCDSQSESPIWHEMFSFPVFTTANHILYLEVWDKDRGSQDDLIGSAEVNLNEYFKVNTLLDTQKLQIKWVPLLHGASAGNSDIQIMVHYLPKSTIQRMSDKFSKSTEAIKNAVAAKIAGYATSYVSSSVAGYFK